MQESIFDVSAKLNDSAYLRFIFEQVGFNSSIDFLETVDSNVDNSNLYIFSATTGWNNRYSISYEKYFKKNISIKLHSEYFIHKNEFGQYKEWDSNTNSLSETIFINGNNEYLPLYTEGSTAPGYIEIEEGEIEIEQYLNPNYYLGFYPRYSSINFNLSFKWEYDSNSEFYIVLRSSKSVNGKIFKDISRMLSYDSVDSWTEKYFDNSIYIKFNHWFEF